MKLFIKIWGAPILIAMLSFFGLLSALIGDHLWDTLSWAALGIPLLCMGWFLLTAYKYPKEKA